MEFFSVAKLAQLLEKELDAATRRALEVAYLLSTMVEEGRPLRFAFLQSPTNYLPEQKLKNPVHGGDAIRRLCLAADPEENVWRIEHDAKKDEIVVTGLANYPFEPFLFPPFAERDILIEVDGVASVTIRVADKLAKYSGCRHYRPNAEGLLPPLIPKGVVEAVAQSGIKTAGLDKNNPYIPWSRGMLPLIKARYDANREKFEATMKEVAQKIVPATILLTLRRMRGLRHGGCLILTNMEKPCANIFAKCNELESKIESGPDAYGYNWALLGYVRVRTHLRMFERDSIVILKDLEDRMPQDVDMMLRQIHLSMHDRQLGRYADLWAQLSTVDGIMVMDRMLEPVIFGGLVSLPADFKEVADKGARHRSGAYCASLLPGSVAIAVSQDGGVTAYRKPADGGSIVETKLMF
jgi:hypothetical protein